MIFSSLPAYGIALETRMQGSAVCGADKEWHTCLITANLHHLQVVHFLKICDSANVVCELKTFWQNGVQADRDMKHDNM